MRGKIAKDIDFLVTDKEVSTKDEIEGQVEITNMRRRKISAWNKFNKIERSKRTTMLRKVLAEHEKQST